jgi:hypothetical protein
MLEAVELENVLPCISRFSATSFRSGVPMYPCPGITSTGHYSIIYAVGGWEGATLGLFRSTHGCLSTIARTPHPRERGGPPVKTGDEAGHLKEARRVGLYQWLLLQSCRWQFEQSDSGRDGFGSPWCLLKSLPFSARSLPLDSPWAKLCGGLVSLRPLCPRTRTSGYISPNTRATPEAVRDSTTSIPPPPRDAHPFNPSS